MKLRVVVIFGVIALSSGFFLNDRCTIYPNPSPRPDESKDYFADIGCWNGTIEWHYPRSTIKVHFRRTAPSFRVCLSDGIIGSQFGLVDATNGNYRILQHVSRDSTEPVCIEAEKHEAILQIQASATLYYMGAIRYEVLPSS